MSGQVLAFGYLTRARLRLDRFGALSRIPDIGKGGEPMKYAVAISIGVLLGLIALNTRVAKLQVIVDQRTTSEKEEGDVLREKG